MGGDAGCRIMIERELVRAQAEIATLTAAIELRQKAIDAALPIIRSYGRRTIEHIVLDDAYTWLDKNDPARSLATTPTGAQEE